jgi:hypothetical protein
MSRAGDGGNIMKRKIRREKGGRWCEVEIEINDGRLSVCGSEGAITKLARAKKDAIEYWRGFFEDQPEEIFAMNKRCGTRYTSALGAAKYVVSVDGDLHGLDVHAQDGDKVYTTESCGQIRDDLAKWFPEVAPLLPWHMNDMKAGCEHQEAEGWAERPIDPSKPTNAYGKHYPGQAHDSWNMLVWVRADEFEGGLLSAPCPTCGYKYGSAWLKRELPAEIIKLAETVCANERAA